MSAHTPWLHRAAAVRSESARPAPLAARHFLLFAFLLLVALPTVTSIALSHQVDRLWLERVVAPKLYQQYGFKADWIAVPGNPESRFTLTTIVPGGVFDRAGFVAGDIPVGFKHGMSSGLLSALASVGPAQRGRFQVESGRGQGNRTIYLTLRDPSTH